MGVAHPGRVAVLDLGPRVCSLTVAQPAAGAWFDPPHREQIALPLHRLDTPDAPAPSGLRDLAAEAVRRLGAAATRAGAGRRRAVIRSGLGPVTVAHLRRVAEEVAPGACRTLSPHAEARTALRAMYDSLGPAGGPTLGCEIEDGAVRLGLVTGDRVVWAERTTHRPHRTGGGEGPADPGCDLAAVVTPLSGAAQRHLLVSGRAVRPLLRALPGNPAAPGGALPTAALHAAVESLEAGRSLPGTHPAEMGRASEALATLRCLVSHLDVATLVPVSGGLASGLVREAVAGLPAPVGRPA